MKQTTQTIIVCTVFLFCSLLLKTLDAYHNKFIREKFIQDNHFSEMLMKVNEEKPDIEKDRDENPYQKTEGCDCPETNFTKLYVDQIHPDKRSVIKFDDKVIMTNVEMNDITVNNKQFMKYNKDENKIVIG